MSDSRDHGPTNPERRSLLQASTALLAGGTAARLGAAPATNAAGTSATGAAAATPAAS